MMPVKRFKRFPLSLLYLLLSLCVAGCLRVTAANHPAPVINGTAAMTCTPTHDDGVSPTYKPNMPVRARVGQGHLLTGVVRSSRDCAPIANARLELWPEYAGRGHPDATRATVLTDQTGRYHFECDLPEHIHMRISAAGYHTIGQNSYHPDGQVEGTFDIVLAPETP